jgi:hypothetical protein
MVATAEAAELVVVGVAAGVAISSSVAAAATDSSSGGSGGCHCRATCARAARDARGGASSSARRTQLPTHQSLLGHEHA